MIPQTILMDRLDTDDFDDAMNTMRNYTSEDWFWVTAYDDDPFLLGAGFCTMGLVP